MNTLISVIIPTYNSEKTIKRTLDSVLNQTYKNIEVLICDDNSTDNTRKLLQEIKDSKVSIFYLDENKGAAFSRNFIMQKAKGDLIAFLDSDDEWYPEKLESQIHFFTDAKIGLIFTGAKINKDNKSIVYFRPNKKWEKDSFRKFFLGEITYMTPTAMIRRDCIEKVGMFDNQLRRNQDFDFFLRILKFYSLKIIDEPLAIIHTNTNKSNYLLLSQSINFYEKNRICFFRENFTTKEINMFFSRKYRDLCAAMIRCGIYYNSLIYLKKAFRYSPIFILKPKNNLTLFKSFITSILNR